MSFSSLTSEQFMQKPTNEPILQYRKGSPELEALNKALKELSEHPVDVPLRIGDKKVFRDLEQRQLIVGHRCDLTTATIPIHY